MRQSDDRPDTQLLDRETWRELVSCMGGRFNPEGIEPDAFTGWVRRVSVSGMTTFEVGSNAPRVERTYRDVRLDGADHYCAVFQVAGRSAMTHNDQTVRFAAGDVALVDVARPSRFFADNGAEPWNSVTLHLPRRLLVSNLGYEPPGGLYRRNGTAAGRLLLDLIRNADGGGSACSPADRYMQLAVYDLVGALFGPPDAWPASGHTDKLFARLRGIIGDRLADPDFGPADVAAEAGISLRYVHKLFTDRGFTCNEFIYGLRLEHAVRLLQRRTSLETGQPLSEIAFASGFRDYTHFARKFRRRFGYPPGAAAGHRRSAGNGSGAGR
jgi:AraC family transcriptional regulator, positive regulator of tynA and feaB